ncbi:MAG: ferritin-like domain-containing protein [Bacillota bacterium]|nr:ferritin-like domain-containing protein [Bacillota bacterium]
MGKKNYILEGEWVLEEMLKVAMEDEKNDWLKYRKIAKMAKRERDRERIFKISDDERRHLKKLIFIYKRLFGTEKIKLHAVAPKEYPFDIAVGKAIATEYQGIAFYKEILSRLSCEDMKEMIRAIMADEQRHARELEDILNHCARR